jgi:hypothetical protein
MGRKCKTGFAKKPLYYERDERKCLPYLEAVAITFYPTSKVVFCIHTRKIRFTSD